MIGQRVDNYQVVRLIGEGGMGQVFEAVHCQIGRRVAIKVLHAELCVHDELVARLFNEARAVNIIQHPSIVSISEFGRLPNGAPYLVMEYLDGEPLGRRLHRLGGFLGPRTIRLVRQIASALAAAHDKGIVHRDLKPDNVMLVADPESTGGERVKLLDFGIAKVMAGGEAAASDAYAPRTRVGALLGTPIYMSPEQCRGAGIIDAKADVYALGVVLFQLLAGRLPFISEGAGELVAMHIYAPPPPLEAFNPTLPPALLRLVESMLAKAKEARPSMGEVAAALERLDGCPLARPQPTAVEPACLPPPSPRSFGEEEAPDTTVGVSWIWDTLPPPTAPAPAPLQRRRPPRSMVWASFTALGLVTASIWGAFRERKSRPPVTRAPEEAAGAPAVATGALPPPLPGPPVPGRRARAAPPRSRPDLDPWPRPAPRQPAAEAPGAEADLPPPSGRPERE